MKTSILLSLFIAIVLVDTTVNVIGGIVDIPRNSVLLTVTMSIAGFATSLLFVHNRAIFRITGLDVFMAILFVLFICSHHSYFSLWNIGCFALFTMYWGVRFTGNNFNFTLLYGAVLLVVLILALTGYLQYAGLLSSNNPYFKLTGPYRNSTIYAGVLCLFMIIPVIWLLFPGYRLRYPKLRSASIFIILLSFPVFLATTCRAAWLAFGVAIGFYIVQLYYRPLKRRWRQLGYSLMGMLVIIFIIYGLYRFKPDSADGRLFIWKVTSRMIVERPITGFGSGGFAANYMHYQAAYLNSRGNDRERFLAGSNHTAYNELLRLIVEYGLLGLLLYISFVYIILKSPAPRNIVTVSARCVLIAGLIWGLFSYPDQAFPIWVVMVLALTFLSVQVAKKMQAFNLSTSFFRGMKIVFLVVALLLCVGTSKQYHAHRTFYDLLYHSQKGESDNFVTGCRSLESVLGDEASFWIFYCTALDHCGYDGMLRDKILHWEQLYPTPDTYIMKGDLLQRMGEMKDAEAAYWLAHNMVPSRQKARSRLVFLYQKQGRMQEATALAHEILSEKVKVYGFETHRIHKELKRIFENQ